jgi:hypothetical protein
MNMDVQRTERIQRPQLFNVVCDILGTAVLMPAWCSFFTIAVVRVQDPRVASATPFSSHHQGYHGTIWRIFDTLPKPKQLLFLLLEMMLVYVAASETLCTAAQLIQIT